MGRERHPRRGSMQIWPRVRAKRIYPRIRSWVKNSKDVVSLGFLGYKVGMTHVMAKDPIAKKGELMIPVSVIECPNMKVFGLRFYASDAYGKRVVADVHDSKIDKDLSRRANVKARDKFPEKFDDVVLVAHAQPKLTGIGKKRPEIFEIAIGGKDKTARIEYAKNMLGKEIGVKDIFKAGEFVDIHGVSKGKGFQGAVKRFGVPLLPPKSEKKKRGIGTLGPWHPNKVSIHVAQPGKMGYHSRTQYNNTIVLVSEDVSRIIPKGDFPQYGKVKNNYVLIKGSVFGARKRPILLVKSIRTKVKPIVYDVTYISQESKTK